jgi:antitoxin component YwqK of YwqJK toxin-antitoxin module
MRSDVSTKAGGMVCVSNTRDTGALITQAGFKEGERQGVWEFRTEADEPLGQLTYHNGKLRHGKQYDADGLLAAHRTY